MMRSPEQKTLIYVKANEDARKLMETLDPGRSPIVTGPDDLSLGDRYVTYTLLHQKMQHILKMLAPCDRWYDEHIGKAIRIEDLHFIPTDRLLIWEYIPDYSRFAIFKTVREQAKARFEEMMQTYKGQYSFNIREYEKDVKEKKIKSPTTADLPMIVRMDDKYIAHPIDAIREMKKRNQDIVLKNTTDKAMEKEKQKNVSRGRYEENFPKIPTSLLLDQFRS